MIDLPTCNYWETRFWFIIWGYEKGISFNSSVPFSVKCFSKVYHTSLIPNKNEQKDETRAEDVEAKKIYENKHSQNQHKHSKVQL